MPAKKIIVALLIILVAIGGFVSGLILLNQSQNTQEQASVPTGQATVKIQPNSGNYKVGDSIDFNVLVNTANISVSGIAVRLTYPFSGSTPEVSVTSIDISPTLLSSGDWSCPTKTSSQQGTKVVIDIACGNTSASGYSNNTDTQFASIKLQVNSVPANNPLVVAFDPAASIITQHPGGQDVLLIPQSSGTYTIAGATQPVATNTPTPTGPAYVPPTSTPTSTPRPTATTKPTATPTKKLAVATGSSTLTPTKVAQLENAGVEYPTLIGLGLGVLLIIGSLIIAL